MIVVADTSPLNYLILIEQIDLLPALYCEVLIPPAVQDEMLDPDAPPPVRAWISDPPPWLEIRTPSRLPLALSLQLDDGERQAITLVHAGGVGSLLLIDELLGRQEATRLGLTVIGTLGIIKEAHDRGLVDLHTAIERLKATNFKASDALLRRFTA
jgi:predicted nucleic acid-binding protein